MVISEADCCTLQHLEHRKLACNSALNIQPENVLVSTVTKDDVPLQALFRKPAGCLWDSEEEVILVADSGNNRIRSFAIGTAVTTRLGTGAAGLRDGPPLESDFNQPSSLGFLPDGRLVVADTQNHVLRVVQP